MLGLTRKSVSLAALSLFGLSYPGLCVQLLHMPVVVGTASVICSKMVLGFPTSVLIGALAAVQKGSAPSAQQCSLDKVLPQLLVSH